MWNPCNYKVHGIYEGIDFRFGNARKFLIHLHLLFLPVDPVLDKQLWHIYRMKSVKVI